MLTHAQQIQFRHKYSQNSTHSCHIQFFGQYQLTEKFVDSKVSKMFEMIKNHPTHFADILGNKFVCVVIMLSKLNVIGMCRAFEDACCLIQFGEHESVCL